MEGIVREGRDGVVRGACRREGQTEEKAAAPVPNKRAGGPRVGILEGDGGIDGKLGEKGEGGVLCWGKRKSHPRRKKGRDAFPKSDKGGPRSCEMGRRTGRSREQFPGRKLTSIRWGGKDRKNSASN